MSEDEGKTIAEAARYRAISRLRAGPPPGSDH